MPFYPTGTPAPGADSYPGASSHPGVLTAARPTTYPTPAVGPGGYPSALSWPGIHPIAQENPAALEQTLARDLVATVIFDLPTGYGYRVERATGAGQVPHWLPDAGAGFTLVEEDTNDAGGSATVAVAVPANDTDYTLAVWAIDPAGDASDPLRINVFGLDEPVIGPTGHLYASIQVTTARAGWPRIEVDTDPAFGSPTVYDAKTDPGGWTICDTTGEVTGNTGDAMPAGGYPAASTGKYLRVEIPSALGNRWVRGYQGSGPTP